MTTAIPDCPTCAIVMTYDRCARQHSCVRCGATIDAAYVSGAPVRPSPPPTLAAREAFRHAENGADASVHSRRTVPSDEPDRWFVVDTEAPAAYRSRPIPVGELSAAARANVDYLWAAQARELMQTPLRDARRKRATIETIAPPPPGVPVEYPVTIANAPPTDAEILDEQLATSMLRTAAAVADSVLGPTDAEIVAGYARWKRTSDLGVGRFTTAAFMHGERIVQVVRDGVTIGHASLIECRAAWSRVLAAKVAASDEKRRRVAMVYGPIDDPDEA